LQHKCYIDENITWKLSSMESYFFFLNDQTENSKIINNLTNLSHMRFVSPIFFSLLLF